MTDKHVESVREKLLQRSQVGIKKYGVTTERNDIELISWLKHLQEELLDGAVYIEAAMERMRKEREAGHEPTD